MVVTNRCRQLCHRPPVLPRPRGGLRARGFNCNGAALKTTRKRSACRQLSADLCLFFLAGREGKNSNRNLADCKFCNLYIMRRDILQGLEILSDEEGRTSTKGINKHTQRNKQKGQNNLRKQRGSLVHRSWYLLHSGHSHGGVEANILRHARDGLPVLRRSGSRQGAHAGEPCPCKLSPSPSPCPHPCLCGWRASGIQPMFVLATNLSDCELGDLHVVRRDVLQGLETLLHGEHADGAVVTQRLGEQRDRIPALAEKASGGAQHTYSTHTVCDSESGKSSTRCPREAIPMTK